MREPPNVAMDRLCACLADEYGISAATLEYLPLGLDMRAGVYRVVAADGAAYLLKVKAGSLYEPGCTVPRYLADQGIAALVAPVPTKRNALWTRLEEQGDWAAIVYPFIDGDHGWVPAMTDVQWRAVGVAIKQIHETALPPEGFPSLRQETFDPAEYGRWIRTFEAQCAGAEGGSRAERVLRDHWMENRSTIHSLQSALEALVPVLQVRSGPYVICHADLHPSNIIRDHAGGVFVIDWDDVMLAPKERDFLFVGDPAEDGSARESGSLFFLGYGPAEIDWVALTYYRCERVVTDVVAFGQEVYCRDDLGEDVKADSAELFGLLFAAGKMVDEAQAAAAHLPADLRPVVGALRRG
jgi:spectinomycin phosphotransferase